MEEQIEVTDPVASAPSDLLELGQWMGRRDAFGAMAGRCSAADVEALKHIRDNRLYTAVCPNWDRFCSEHLRVSRRYAEREIQNLEKFGRAFFAVRQLAKVGVRAYETIAEHVTDEGVHHNGATVPLLPENGSAVHAAIKALVAQAASGRDEEPERPPFDGVLTQMRAAARNLQAFAGALDRQQGLALAQAVVELLGAARGCGIQLTN